MTVSAPASPAEQFFQRGWVAFGHDPALAAWVAKVRPVAERLASDQDLQAAWLRCGGTWFAGVNVLPNDATGAIPPAGVPPLSGEACAFAGRGLRLGGFAWDQAQVSVCYPGYPQPWEGESDSAFRFRRDRDAAHVDGLRRIMPGRRRTPGEVHGFILGIPVTEAPEDAAPMVVYEGSHEIIRKALSERLSGIAPAQWPEEDVTEAYAAARRQCFEECPRRTVHARPGGAYVVHRLALHGVAPWRGTGTGKRMVIYFRPDPRPGGDPGWWLTAP